MSVLDATEITAFIDAVSDCLAQPVHAPSSMRGALPGDPDGGTRAAAGATGHAGWRRRPRAAMAGWKTCNASRVMDIERPD